MSGAVGNNVLREYLVSLKYQVDAAGKRNFVNSLTDIAGRILGSKAAVLGLASALVLMTKRMAEASEQLYFMSQRTQTSATNIQSATDAMTRFGVSAEGAHGALEAFSSWQRSQGPAATLFLRSLGVNAGDATEQMAQLGQVLQRMGGRIGQEGTLGYALALQTAQMAGLNETAFRALIDPNLPAQIARSRQLLLEASGLDEAGTQQMTTNAHEVANAFRDYGTVFEGFSNAFRAALFPAVLPALKEIFQVIRDNREAIRNFLVETARLIGALATGLATLIHLFSEFPTAVKLIVGGLAALVLGLGSFARALLLTPFGLFMTGMAALLLLLEDYATWKKGQEQGTGADTMFDWGNLQKLGIEPGPFAAVLASLIAISVLAPKLLGVAKAIRGIAAATGLARIAALGSAGIVMGALAALGYTFFENQRENDELDRKAGEMGFEKRGGSWWDPTNKIPHYVNPKTGEDLTYPQMRDLINKKEGRPSQASPTLPGIIGDWWRRLQGGQGPGETETRPDSGAVPGSAQGFYDETYNNIYRAAVAKGLPNPAQIARIGAAQASQETGYGKHMVGNNIFGIKGAGVTAMTTEFEGGRMVSKPQSFAAFGSRADAAAGYVDFLLRNPRYAALIAAGNDQQALAALQASGYATDPNYARSVGGIASRFGGRTLVPAGPGLGGGQRNDVNVNQTTSITVAQGPTATDTAAAVAREQARVNEGLIRDTTAAMA